MNIKDGDQAFYRFVKWERHVNKIFIEAIGSGEIHIYLDDEQEPSGFVIVKDGNVFSSSFQGNSGKHALSVEFSKSSRMELHALCFG